MSPRRAEFTIGQDNRALYWLIVRSTETGKAIGMAAKTAERRTVCQIAQESDPQAVTLAQATTAAVRAAADIRARQ
jgi:hypothetical protein